MSPRQKETLRFCLNLVFAAYNCILGIVSASLWFLSLGAYYINLSVMRICVISFSDKTEKNDQFIMKFSGIMIFVLSLILSFIVYMTIEQEGATKYHEIVMITIALYAFTKLTLAIIAVVKGKKNKCHSTKTLHSIAFADSIVSIYSLQRSMLVSFEGMKHSDIILMNTLSGIAMCIMVIFIGINLIKGEKKMAKSKIVKGVEKISDNVVKGYKKVEDTVVGGYKKVEKTFVDGYEKIENAFVDRYLTKDGETVEEAKERLKKSNKNN